MKLCCGVTQFLLSNSSWRFVSLFAPRMTAYDVKKFVEPLTDFDMLQQPLPENDERNFMFLKSMKSDETPVFYRSKMIDKLIRVCMLRGEKETMRRKVYLALEIVKRRQYKAWLKADEETRKTIELDPFQIAENAITNIRPRMKLTIAIRGGITYQIPSPIDEEESIFRAMKMLREVCRTKTKAGATHLENILANEFLAAAKNEGHSIQAKQELHRVCEANRAFAHYRSK